MNHSLSSSSYRRHRRCDSDSKNIDYVNNGASSLTIDMSSQTKVRQAILEKFGNLFCKKILNIQLRAFLFIHSTTKMEISSPTSYKSRNLSNSRLSSNTFVDNSSLNNTFSEHSSISYGRSAVREIVGIVSKKIILAKIHPFQRLKKHLIFERQSRKSVHRGVYLLRLFEISYIRRLKQEALSKMVKAVLSTVRSEKSNLKMYLKSSLKKAGQHLIKVMQKVRKGVIWRSFNDIKIYMNLMRRLCRFYRLMIRKYKYSSEKLKRLMWNKLRDAYTKSCGQHKSASLGFRHLQRIYLGRLKISWMTINSKAKSTRLLPIRNKLLCKTLRNLRIKCLSGCFSRLSNILSIQQATYYAVNKTKYQCRVEYERNRKAEFAQLEYCLEYTEHALKIYTVENEKLTKKYIEMEKQISDLTRQLKNMRISISKLERELKDKDTLIRKFLQQQNSFSEAIKKQREYLSQLKNSREFHCYCQSLESMEIVDLAKVYYKVQSIIDKFVDCYQHVVNVYSSVKRQFYYFKECLEPISKLLDALCLNPRFKNEYPSLCQIRNDYVELTKFVGHTQYKCLSFMALESFTKHIRNLFDNGDSEAAEILMYELLEGFGCDDTLVRAKILYFVKNSELYSRELRKCLDKNALLKTFWMRLEGCEKELIYHSNKTIIEMVARKNTYEQQLPQWNQAYLSKMLFEFLHSETPYNVRVQLKTKMEAMLNIQPDNSY